MRGRVIGLFLLLTSLTGCGSIAGSAKVPDISNDLRSARLQHVFGQLIAGHPDLQVNARVMDSGVVCAYAWPNGTIYVTRGLMDRGDDAVIAAAIAHEIGHLLSDGHVPAVASLKGCSHDPDGEIRADAYGVGLLRLQHLPDDAMARMLILVRDANTLTPDCKIAMTRRIELVSKPPLASLGK